MTIPFPQQLPQRPVHQFLDGNTAPRRQHFQPPHQPRLHPQQGRFRFHATQINKSLAQVKINFSLYQHRHRNSLALASVAIRKRKRKTETDKTNPPKKK